MADLGRDSRQPQQPSAPTTDGTAPTTDGTASTDRANVGRDFIDDIHESEEAEEGGRRNEKEKRKAAEAEKKRQCDEQHAACLAPPKRQCDEQHTQCLAQPALGSSLGIDGVHTTSFALGALMACTLGVVAYLVRRSRVTKTTDSSAYGATTAK